MKFFYWVAVLGFLSLSLQADNKAMKKAAKELKNIGVILPNETVLVGKITYNGSPVKNAEIHVSTTEHDCNVTVRLKAKTDKDGIYEIVNTTGKKVLQNLSLRLRPGAYRYLGNRLREKFNKKIFDYDFKDQKAYSITFTYDGKPFAPEPTHRGALDPRARGHIQMKAYKKGKWYTRHTWTRRDPFGRFSPKDLKTQAETGVEPKIVTGLHYIYVYAQDEVDEYGFTVVYTVDGKKRTSKEVKIKAKDLKNNMVVNFSNADNTYTVEVKGIPYKKYILYSKFSYSNYAVSNVGEDKVYNTSVLKTSPIKLKAGQKYNLECRVYSRENDFRVKYKRFKLDLNNKTAPIVFNMNPNIVTLTFDLSKMNNVIENSIMLEWIDKANKSLCTSQVRFTPGKPCTLKIPVAAGTQVRARYGWHRKKSPSVTFKAAQGLQKISFSN